MVPPVLGDVVDKSFAEKLNRYADLIVRVGVGIQAGQRLVLRGPLEGAELVRAVARSAYQAGARLVDVMWSDDELTRIRFEHAPRDSFDEFAVWRAAALVQAADRGDAVLSIHATDPDLLKEYDPKLVAQARQTADKHSRPFLQRAASRVCNWCAISMPIPSWAAKVFPNATPDEAVRQLWEAIFSAVRVNNENPVAAWEAHIQALEAKCRQLNAKQYAALHFKNELGTDLTVGLPKGHIWNGGRMETQGGIPFTPNLPTEEVFTLPHKDQVDGVAHSTKPLSYNGRLIEDFGFRFEKGQVVDVWAKRGEEILKSLIASDDGARRLGEVALVPHSSPISQSGLLFLNTLFDENAASHVALGNAYRFCLEGGNQMPSDEFSAAGGNESQTHVDFMIGSADMNVDGITQDGHKEPLMRGGEWV